MLSVDGQRGRPSAAVRFERLKVVAIEPGAAGEPGRRQLVAVGELSIAAQIRAWDSTRPLRAPRIPAYRQE